MAEETLKAETEVKAPVELTIEQVKEDLKNGISRDDMKERYGLKRADIMRLFKHPDLKGLKVHTSANKPKKTRKKATPGFILKDATGADVTAQIYAETPKAENGTEKVEDANKASSAVDTGNDALAAAPTAATAKVDANDNW